MSQLSARPQDVAKEMSMYPPETWLDTHIYAPPDEDRTGIVHGIRRFREMVAIRHLTHSTGGEIRPGIVKQTDIVIHHPTDNRAQHDLGYLIGVGARFLMIAPMSLLGTAQLAHAVQGGSAVVFLRGSSLSKFRVDDGAKSDGIDEDGHRIRIQRHAWVTNLEDGWLKPITDETPHIVPRVEFEEWKYRLYDDRSAIDVPRLADIPTGCPWPMGVPISYLGFHNPKYFDIVGVKPYPRIKGAPLFRRLLIKERTQ